MAIEKLKINYKAQKPNHKLKTIKGQGTDTDQTIDTIQKTRTHVFKILNTTCGENCESSWVKVSL
jgi:hypothetical protein